MADDTNPVSLPDLHSALEELIAETLPPQLGRDEVTIMMVSARLKCTYKTAIKRITEWQEVGRVEFAGERLVNGKNTKAWRIVKKVE